MSGWQLAELNIARWKVDPESPAAADFINNIDRINALAESSPGFVWRLKDEDTGNAMAVDQPFGPEFIVNLSVWESIEALKSYVYKTSHREILARRQEWFSHMELAHMVMWWVPAGHQPDLAEAHARLQRLDRDGPSVEAFTFRQPFDAPVEAA